MKQRFKSRINKIVELTQERANHIFEFHPDVKPYLSGIAATLTNPDEIRRSKHDIEILLFYKKFFIKNRRRKYLAVVVKVNERNFVLTCYLTDKILTGEKIYGKNK